MIVYGSQRYKLLDEDGNYNPNWYNESNGLYQGYEFLSDEFKLIKEDFSSDYDYYALFKIWDTENNSYFSNVAKMKGQDNMKNKKIIIIPIVILFLVLLGLLIINIGKSKITIRTSKKDTLKHVKLKKRK